MASYLEIRNITKSFHGNCVLQHVSLEVGAGEIHVIMGENGAGKSTLMKILAGLYRQDEGEIILDGESVSFDGPLDSQKHHIAMIHQELTPEPFMTVAENVWLGREPGRGIFVNKQEMIDRTRRLLSEIGVNIRPETEMRNLSMAQKQLVEIAKAVSMNSRVLIMDEPTSALSEAEIDKLYELIFRLKAEGVAIIFISHKLDEVFRVADRITVLRDGEFIASGPSSDFDANSLIALMVGRDIKDIYGKEQVPAGKTVLEVRHLTKEGCFSDISFELHEHEILGIAGLVGAGRTELLETIFGLRRADSGQIFIRGKEVDFGSATEAAASGLGMVPESRAEKGLNLKGTIGENASIAGLDLFSRGDFIEKREERKGIDGILERLHVKPAKPDRIIRGISGGNQQKIVLGKWLMRDSDILLLDEPTRGIDVGAKSEVYHLMNELVKENKAILMVSSELPEIVGMSDRVLVMCEGRLTGELTGEDINQQTIMHCATGQVGEEVE